MELIVVESAAALAERAAQWIARDLRAAVAARGTYHLALAGGSTPRATHERLAALPDLPWHAVHVYFGDERAVPPEHADSNYRMARESLLERVAIPPHQIHRMEAERADLDAAARDYGRRLPDRLDLVILGLGEDGHTASLFPGQPALDEPTREVLVVDGAPKPPPRRLTLGLMVIGAARVKLVLSAGAGKAEILARVLEGEVDLRALPAQVARAGTWIVDAAAAASLRRTADRAFAAPRPHRVLAGDVGGTKTLLAVAESAGPGQPLRLVREARFENREHQGLAPLVRQFLGSGSRTDAVDRACLAVAATIRGDECTMPNLGWVIRAPELAAAAAAPVELINDFAAIGWGIPELGDADRLTLQPGVPVEGGPIAYLGAGTGLGQGFMLTIDGRRHVLPSEGGHGDFAPTDEVELGIWRHLQRQFGRVSYERVLSGAGLAAVYRALVAELGRPESEAVRREMTGDDPAAVVTRLGLSGADPTCVEAIDRFLRIYGAEAGNWGLRILATGGVYVAGGIAPRLGPKLEQGAFMRAFNDKGRFAALTAALPVHVILNTRVGLLGAAARALETLQKG